MDPSFTTQLIYIIIHVSVYIDAVQELTIVAVKLSKGWARHVSVNVQYLILR